MHSLTTSFLINQLFCHLNSTTSSVDFKPISHMFTYIWLGIWQKLNTITFIMGRIYYRIVVLEIHYLALGVHTKLATEFTLISSDKQQTNYL